jgi:hypothetical protein
MPPALPTYLFLSTVINEPQGPFSVTFILVKPTHFSKRNFLFEQMSSELKSLHHFQYIIIRLVDIIILDLAKKVNNNFEKAGH